MIPENVPRARNRLATTSLILGILAVLGSFLGRVFIIAPLLGVARIITGAIALKQVKEQVTKRKEFAIAGIATGSISLVWVFLSFVIVFLLIKSGWHY